VASAPIAQAPNWLIGAERVGRTRSHAQCEGFHDRGQARHLALSAPQAPRRYLHPHCHPRCVPATSLAGDASQAPAHAARTAIAAAGFCRARRSRQARIPTALRAARGTRPASERRHNGGRARSREQEEGHWGWTGKDASSIGSHFGVTGACVLAILLALSCRSFRPFVAAGLSRAGASAFEALARGRQGLRSTVSCARAASSGWRQGAVVPGRGVCCRGCLRARLELPLPAVEPAASAAAGRVAALSRPRRSQACLGDAAQLWLRLCRP